MQPQHQHSQHQNRTKPPKTWVLGQKKWIGHVRRERTRNTFGSTKSCFVCSPNTRFRRESHETTQNMSFGPKGVDWACSLPKNKKHFWKHKVVHCMQPQHPLSQHRNTKKQEFWAQRSGLGMLVAKEQKNTFGSTKWCIVCTPNTRFCKNEIARNYPKHEFRAKRSGLGMFIAKEQETLLEA